MILNKEPDGFSDAPGNMACDEILFSGYLKTNVPCLRVYSWAGPSITLGYFQSPGATLDLTRCAGENIGFTRRITGGAAILHFREITYSLIFSRHELGLGKGVKNSFRELAGFLLDFYGRLDLKAGFAADVCVTPDSLGRYGGFCFSRREHFDILIDGKKIGGNAQKRRKDIIFQQGSIPLLIDFSLVKRIIKSTPRDLPSLARGVYDFCGEKPAEDLMCELADSFSRRFKVDFKETALSQEEKIEAGELVKNKYSNKEWIFSNEKTSLAE